MRKHLLCYYYIYRLLWDITFPLTGLKHLLQLLFAFPHYWSGWAAVCVYWLSLCLVFWNCIDLLFDQVVGFVKQSAHHFFILNNFQVKISVYALKMNVLNLHSKINLFFFYFELSPLIFFRRIYISYYISLVTWPQIKQEAS